jgi:hypothetical protein
VTGRLATTVGAILCCAHRDVLGRLHGHTWAVWARFPNAGARRDAVVLQQRLEGCLSAWDHTELPPELAEGEDIAGAVAQLLGDADYVLVERRLEMILGEWWAS